MAYIENYGAYKFSMSFEVNRLAISETMDNESERPLSLACDFILPHVVSERIFPPYPTEAI